MGLTICDYGALVLYENEQQLCTCRRLRSVLYSVLDVAALLAAVRGGHVVVVFWDDTPHPSVLVLIIQRLHSVNPKRDDIPKKTA